jgi:hypothetical protein
MNGNISLKTFMPITWDWIETQPSYLT